MPLLNIFIHFLLILWGPLCPEELCSYVKFDDLTLIWFLICDTFMSARGIKKLEIAELGWSWTRIQQFDSLLVSQLLCDTVSSKGIKFCVDRRSTGQNPLQAITYGQDYPQRTSA
jgi:hypothetical protein